MKERFCVFWVVSAMLPLCLSVRLFVTQPNVIRAQPAFLPLLSEARTLSEH